MVIIQNVSGKDVPIDGVNDYELRINNRLICRFQHKREFDGLAQCLRDAADAVEEERSRKILWMMEQVERAQDV